VISRADVCIGAAEADHDLSGLRGHRLRTHGGASEARVPIVINRSLNDEYRLKAAGGALKSYQLFDYALNGVS
jgi:phosphonoacetate hydrolase